MYLGVVLNPLARRNRKDRGARARRLRRLLGPWGEVHETPSIDALSGTLEGLLPRATHLVSDGGDGALHWMINTVRALRGEDERWPTFVPTNGGTIDFVARKVGVRGRSESIVRALTAFAMAGREPEEVTLDSLLLTGALEDGTPFDRVGFALAAGGVGNRFFDKYYADPAPSPTTIAKVIGRTVSEWTAARVAPGGRGLGAHELAALEAARRLRLRRVHRRCLMLLGGCPGRRLLAREGFMWWPPSALRG